MTRIDFTPQGKIVLHVRDGDLVIRGDAGSRSAQLQATPFSDGEGDATPEFREGETHLHVRGSATLNVPAGVDLAIEGAAADVVLRNLGHVSLASCRGDLVANDLASLALAEAVKGDAALRKIGGDLRLQSVNGDLAVAQCASVHLERVGGDASFSNVTEVHLGDVGGDLSVSHAAIVQVKSVNGDVALTSIGDAAALKMVHGDLMVVAPGASLAATEVHGDVQLRGPLQAGGKYWINAGGDVAVRVSGNVRIAVRAGGEILAGHDVQVLGLENGLYTARLGQDEEAADLNIEAKGDVVLNSSSRDHRHRSRAVDAELRRAMSEVRRELRRTAVDVKAEVARAKRQVAVELGRPELRETIGGSVREMVRDLFSSLDPKIPPVPPVPPVPPRPPSAAAPPSDEMRLILEMLETGTITVEDAEKLIAALKS